MNLSTRILETTTTPQLDALQIVFTRMAVTWALGTAYMWYARVPDFLLGPPGVRGLLFARGFVGFFGLFGMYFSLRYLSLSDATVITFLAPPLSGYAASVFLGESFGAVEKVAAFTSFAGVVLVAQPAPLFPLKEEPSTINVTAAQKLVALLVALSGVLGATGAFLIVRRISYRAHPLVVVNYFSMCCVLVSGLALALTPSLGFVLPVGGRQWGLLALIGVFGFLYQAMLTAGLQREKPGRATNMIYLQMFFAFVFQWALWHQLPSALELAGTGIILVSAVAVAASKTAPEPAPAEVVYEMAALRPSNEIS
ncbi:uncharacterized protein V1510DRAFT_419688 [Dipodascopsis tothii]|uniref:uncharacterized protein n=1 Tax=Dipodascopsis tothii TaxID=44089 RepID=UPI0034CF8989